MRAARGQQCGRGGAGRATAAAPRPCARRSARTGAAAPAVQQQHQPQQQQAAPPSPARRARRRDLGLAAAAALAAAATAARPPPAAAGALVDEARAQAVYAAAAAAVVALASFKPTPGGGEALEALGSGVLFDGSGHVVTNYHGAARRAGVPGEGGSGGGRRDGLALPAPPHDAVASPRPPQTHTARPPTPPSLVVSRYILDKSGAAGLRAVVQLPGGGSAAVDASIVGARRAPRAAGGSQGAPRPPPRTYGPHPRLRSPPSPALGRTQCLSNHHAKRQTPGTDAARDLAVLALAGGAPPGAAPPLPLARSGRLRVGQAVFSLGAGGGGGASMSAGVVSGLGRAVPAPTGGRIFGVIQARARVCSSLTQNKHAKAPLPGPPFWRQRPAPACARAHQRRQHARGRAARRPTRAWTRPTAAARWWTRPATWSASTPRPSCARQRRAPSRCAALRRGRRARPAIVLRARRRVAPPRVRRLAAPCGAPRAHTLSHPGGRARTNTLYCAPPAGPRQRRRLCAPERHAAGGGAEPHRLRQRGRARRARRDAGAAGGARGGGGRATTSGHRRRGDGGRVETAADAGRCASAGCPPPAPVSPPPPPAPVQSPGSAATSQAAPFRYCLWVSWAVAPCVLL